MKVLIIPDIHGSNHWKKNFLDNIDKVDKCVFLGDYVDSFNNKEKGETAVKNFEDILNTTEQYKGKVNLLLGNHDISYIYQYHGDPHVSGHQSEMTKEYNNMFVENADRIQIAAKYDDWVFSHAGFTNTWYKYVKSGYDIICKRDEKKVPDNPIDLVNWMWKTDKDIRMLNFSHIGLDPYGDDVNQGPLWIRPTSLLYDPYYTKQVVGHTEVFNPPKVLRSKGNTLIVVDSQEHNSYLILDTEKEYI